ncbi:uncharacterized protein LOC122282961 isoform X2 [Carya illinoinensis]|uniref:uncharacterized protein LOC122282961 isoform X2 n=1 Tax=Carya illinoinensis TaxID=32201 RepID=UPI001C726062|nr:uncharacterized protein LOC122282961 isoform X2 [Carya illinoinensis]
MDKSWMNLTDRLLSPAYAEGVNTFLTLARNHSRGSDRIRCPCRSCCNNLFLPIFNVETHLFIKGINPNYTQWIFHGEEETRSFNDDDDKYIDDMDHMLDDIQAGTFVDVPRDHSNPLPTGGSIPDAPPSSSTDQLLEDARCPLFSGCTDATSPTVLGANQEQPKRRRGPAKCTEFKKLRKHGKVFLKINDGETAPCCENASMFTTRVKQIVRQHCDMSYTRWTDVPQAQKDKLIDCVRGDFVLDWDLENHRLTVLKQLRKRFNAFHHELHKKYLSYGSHEEALASGSSMVDPAIWVKLCGRWGSDDFKKISRQNRENRKRLTINHTAGRKSFVRILEEKQIFRRIMFLIEDLPIQISHTCSGLRMRIWWSSIRRLAGQRRTVNLSPQPLKILIRRWLASWMI